MENFPESYNFSLDSYFSPNLKVMDYFYEKIDKFNLSSYYFFYKGIQYENGIYKKKKNFQHAIEFYKQGSNLNNFICFFRLFVIYGNISDEKTKSNYNQDKTKENNEIVLIDHNLYVIGNSKYQSLYYLLKFFSYYDNNSPTKSVINIDLNDLKEKLISNIVTIRDYINKYQNALLITDTELKYLKIILLYLETNESGEYFKSLLDLYKIYKHEESLYKIIEFVIKTNQFNLIEGLISELFNSSTKNLAILFKLVILENRSSVSKNFMSYENLCITWSRKLKIGGYYGLYAEILVDGINLQELILVVVYTTTTTDIDSNYNSFDTLNSKIKKILNNYKLAVLSGDFDYSINLFYLNKFYCKYLGNLDLDSSQIVEIFELSQISPEHRLISALMYLKGVRVKKCLKKALSILTDLSEMNNNDTYMDKEISLLANYFIHKCYRKMYNQELIRKQEEFLIKQFNSCCDFDSDSTTKLSFRLNYIISKFFISINTSIAFKILNQTYKYYYSNFSNTSNTRYRPFSLSIIDKIFLFKIVNLLNSRYEFHEHKKSICFSDEKSYFFNCTDINTSIGPVVETNENICDMCVKNEKNVIAFPCGHKFICYQCLNSELNLNLLLEEGEGVKCKKCNRRIESVIKKIFM